MVMDIIIAGALPHTTIAGEALNYLPKAAPHLLERLETHRAQTQHIDVEALGCTPLEYYLLQAAGLPAQASSLAAYYLPADLRQYVQEGQAIYLLRLGHIALGQTSASLHTADELAITPAQSLALFENAQTIFAHSPYKLLAYHPDYFLVDLGPEFNAELPSPNLLATGFLNDWWPQDDATRPLRALLSELQMSWFNHPVNQEREAQGKRTINTAWIFGGIKGTAELMAHLPITSTENHHAEQAGRSAKMVRTDKGNYLLISDLLYSHRQQDWGIWLQQLSLLDQRLPEIVARASTATHTNNHGEDADSHASPYRLVLCGLDRQVTLSPQSWVKRTLQSKNQWKSWW